MKNAFYTKAILGAIVIFILTGKILVQGAKEKNELPNVKGEITFIDSSYQDLPNRNFGKYRYILLDNYSKVIEVFIGKGAWDFKPEFERVDELKVGDEISVYYFDNEINDIQVNRLIQFIDKGNVSYFVRGKSNDYIAYFCIVSAVLVLILVIIFDRKDKSKLIEKTAKEKNHYAVVNIRLLQKNEIPFLKEMLYVALYVREGQPSFPRSILESPEIAKYIVDWGSKKGDLAIVAEIEGELVAAIWGRVFTAEEKSYGFIDEQTPEIGMAVKEGFRGQGIGTRLIMEASKEYHRLVYQALSLSVDKENPAIKLYERMGFEFFEESGTAVTMKKKLP